MDNGNAELRFNINKRPHDRHIEYNILGYIQDKNTKWINRIGINLMVHVMVPLYFNKGFQSDQYG